MCKFGKISPCTDPCDSFSGFSWLLLSALHIHTNDFKTKENIWNDRVNKAVNKPKYILHLRFLEELPFALLTDLHTLGILSISFSRDGVPTFLKELPEVLNTAVLPPLCSLTHPKPSQLSLGQAMWRPGHLTQHSITPHWSHSSSIAWRCIWGHCPVKRNTGPTKHCRMLWQPCWLSVPCTLN